MDFFVREVRAVVEGPMAIIRFGTCGGITDHSRSGTIVVATEGSSYISRNYNFFPSCNENIEPYFFYNVIFLFLIVISTLSTLFFGFNRLHHQIQL